MSIYVCSMAEAASLTAEVDALRGKKSPGTDDYVTLLCLGLRFISYSSYIVKLRQCDLRRAMKIWFYRRGVKVKEINGCLLRLCAKNVVAVTRWSGFIYRSCPILLQYPGKLYINHSKITQFRYPAWGQQGPKSISERQIGRKSLGESACL